MGGWVGGWVGGSGWVWVGRWVWVGMGEWVEVGGFTERPCPNMVDLLRSRKNAVLCMPFLPPVSL